MDKMTFASYKFKPNDVIEGLNRYFAETKAFRYRKVPLEIQNGVWTSNPDYRKDIIFTNSPPDCRTRSGRVCWAYYLICDPEEVVSAAINWLREEHDIFYTPGMEAPAEDFDVFEADKEYEEATKVVPVAKVRAALGIAEDSDIFQCIKYWRHQRETLRTELRIQKCKVTRLEGELETSKASNERAHSEMYKARGEKYDLEKKVRDILGINREVDFFEALKCAKSDMDATFRLRAEKSELSHRNTQLCKRIADIRNATGMDAGDPGDLVEFIKDMRAKLDKDQEEFCDWRGLYLDTINQRDEWKKKAEDTKAAWDADSWLKNRIVGEQRDFIMKVAEILDVTDPFVESEYKETIDKLRTIVTHPNRYKWLYENLKTCIQSDLEEAASYEED